MFNLSKIVQILKPALISITLFLFVVTVYHVFFANRIIYGVFIGDVNVGGLTYNQAKSRLEQRAKNLPETIELSYQEKTFDIKPAEFNLKYDYDSSIVRAFELGRTGDFFIDNRDKVAGFVKGIDLPAQYDFDDESFGMLLSGIKGEINIDYRNAEFALQDGKLVKIPGNDGIHVSDKKLYDRVILSLNNFDFSEKNIEVEHVTPSVLLADLSHVQDQVEKAVFNPPQLKLDKKEWKLTPAQALDLVGISSKNGKVFAELDDSAFETYVEVLSQEVNQAPRGKITEVKDGKVVNFEITKSGKEINQEQFSDLLAGALFEGGKTVDIPVRDVDVDSDKDKYGLYALLGEGVSKFTGSASGRIHNLSLAAERTNGVLIPPNTIYSFNQTVGDISAATGYNSAYIIQNGRTVLGEGGGVCQTSTTLFRAVLNAGLPIITRYPHAYRVGYYEIGSPVGFDASIFQPSLDFQFKNDTPNYILIETVSDKSTNTLTFRIYGTPDGRSVDISTPVVTNVIPAPEPLYQDDDTLEKGVVKQVDWAANGATVSFTREVKKGGEIILKDTFNSKYQPWRAVYLKGTKD